MLDKYQFLGHNLRFFRTQRGLHQRELAMRGAPTITQPLVSRLERGYRPASDDVVDVLAWALHVSAHQLLQRPRVIRSDDPVRVIPRRADEARS